MTPTAFYAVSDARYFLGAVGLINSLRLVGHDEPVYLLDCGLTDAQRALLEPHVTLVRDDSGTPPWLLKTIAPLRHPAETMVLIDADMVLTRRLDELVERARAGALVAFRTRYDRHYPEWGEVLELGELRRREYVCSALVVAERGPAESVLRVMHDRRDRVAEIAFDPRPERHQLFFALDQDVLNAVISSELAPLPLAALDYRLAPAPPFEGLRLADLDPPRCAYEDGVEPFAVHQHGPKPWLDRVEPSVYSRLLARHLDAGDLAIRLPRGMIPRRFRERRLSRLVPAWPTR